VTPLTASQALWDIWIVSWAIAAVWTRRTTARARPLDQFLHLAPFLAGTALLFFGESGQFGPDFIRPPGRLLWRLPLAADWSLTVVVAIGLGFTWWARVTIGSFWSSGVSRKDGQAIVQSGPYRLVRHPIYTGLILAAAALATQIGMPTNLAGAALIALSFFLKARLEERLLGEALGPDYAAYRARTPMLTPFWPARR